MPEYDNIEIRIEAKGTMVERLYDRAEFSLLLVAAARECLRYARETYCVLPPPDGIFFFVGKRGLSINFNEPQATVAVPFECVIRAEDAATIVVREDGYHLSDIHITPFGVTVDATVFRLHWSIYGWTNSVLIGHPMFPHPPFILTGPTIPIGHPATNPFTRIRLPAIQCAQPLPAPN